MPEALERSRPRLPESAERSRRRLHGSPVRDSHDARQWLQYKKRRCFAAGLLTDSVRDLITTASLMNPSHGRPGGAI